MISQILMNGVVTGLSWGLIALGFGLIYSTVRILHAAHAATYLVGAYTGVLLMRAAPGATVVVALLAAMGAAALLGFLIELTIYRPLRKLGSSSLALFLASLALVVVVQNTIALVFGSEIQVARGRIGQSSFRVLGASITSWQAISAGVVVLLFVLTWGFVSFTRVGKMLRAVGSDANLAEAVGISRDNMFLLAICLGSALAGAAGFLIGFDTAVTPAMGFGVLLIGVTAAIVGGIGSNPGAMLGGLLVGVAHQLGVWKLPTQWQDAIVFLVLIAFLLLRPQGFLGRSIRTASV